MATLEEVNNLRGSGIDDFRLDSFDGSQLRIVGSFDLTYYHDVELTFGDVSYVNCPTHFMEPRFREGPLTSEGKRFEITTDEGNFFIEAASVSVAIGKVFYYQRDVLKPGERIASWVLANDSSNEKSSSGG